MYLNEAIDYKSEKPRVSIGLPVFNGEKYLEKTLDSILAQTYPDFELIISDNASTDNTPRICRAYADKDSHILYYRNERNIGAAMNFNRVFELSSGEYFKWAAHDDLIAPEYISKCVDILDKDPSIVLCHSRTVILDEHGELIGTSCVSDRMKIDSRKTHQRFGSLIRDRKFPSLIFGVIRSSVLKMTPLIENYIGSDRNLLAQIALIGRIYEVPEYLFFRRKHSESFSRKVYPRFRDRLAWLDPKKRGQISFQYGRRILEFFKSIRCVPLKWSERFLCYAQIGVWFFRVGYVLIGYEIKKAIQAYSCRDINIQKGE